MNSPRPLAGEGEGEGPKGKKNFYGQELLATRNLELETRNSITALFETILFPTLQNRLAHRIRRLSHFAAKVLLLC